MAYPGYISDRWDSSMGRVSALVANYPFRGESHTGKVYEGEKKFYRDLGVEKGSRAVCRTKTGA